MPRIVIVDRKPRSPGFRDRPAAARPCRSRSWSYGDVRRSCRGSISGSTRCRTGRWRPGEKRPALTIDDPVPPTSTPPGRPGCPRPRTSIITACSSPCGPSRPSPTPRPDGPDVRLPADVPTRTVACWRRAPAMMAGGTCVIRERFSARDFWPDVAAQPLHDVRLHRRALPLPAQTPRRPRRPRPSRPPLFRQRACAPTSGSRSATGSALRHIREFYASTEGNCSMFNLRFAARGRRPRAGLDREPVPDRGDPLRRRGRGRGAGTADGRCIACAPDEVGEVVGQILSDPPQKPATASKAIPTARPLPARSCTTSCGPGDSWFRTGDLMRRDAEGYFYFVDRVGDTFRWKGENVATLQVAEVLTGYPGIAEANVYGVAVPGTEGRAGMACARARGTRPLRPRGPSRLPGGAAAGLCGAGLPAGSRAGLDVTGTFKQRKLALVAEGFDPARVGGRPSTSRRRPDAVLSPLDGTRRSRMIRCRSAAALAFVQPDVFSVLARGGPSLKRRSRRRRIGQRSVPRRCEVRPDPGRSALGIGAR